MAGLLGVTDYARYGGPMGEPSYIADSAATALTTGTWTLTANFAAVGGIQPTINYCRCFLAIWTISASTVITTLDVTMDDGTTTVTVLTMPAPVAASAQRGLQVPFECFNSGKDGGLAVVTGIANVIAKVVNTGGAQTSTGRLYVLGYV